MKIYTEQTNRRVIEKVNIVFYEKVYAHPWLSLYFKFVEKEFITQQQTDFMLGALGGKNVFGGRNPSKAHPHLYITDELYDLRQDLLVEALDETNASEELVEAWLKIDQAFRKSIVKKSPSECQGRYRTEPVINFDSPISTHITH